MEGFTMDFGRFQFGSIKIDGVSYKHDVLSTGGKIRQRRKKPSKKFREEFRHTLVSVDDAFARKKAVEDSTYPQPNSLDRRGILRVLS